MLDEIVRDGARQMLATALQAEVPAYVEAFADQVDELGRRLMVRNGHRAEREVVTAAGVVPVRAPRVNDMRTDEETVQRPSANGPGPAAGLVTRGPQRTRAEDAKYPILS